ncbi:hypothetical protein PR048_002364 [Dryococelus australis]|uniref:Uncharacterized protein n=1 Tax=Dryococelus australis TaxID=614101 RepID=A0ABQ9IJZ3_9NEOP|nr:hypothetical protein PR048_002364 [Dryococelus australis]
MYRRALLTYGRGRFWRRGKGWLPDAFLPTFTRDVELLMAQKSEDGEGATTELPVFLAPSAGSLRTLPEVTAVGVAVRLAYAVSLSGFHNSVSRCSASLPTLAASYERYLSLHNRAMFLRRPPATQTVLPSGMLQGSLVQRYDGNTARLARRSDEALEVRVSVARIAPSFLGRGLARVGEERTSLRYSPSATCEPCRGWRRCALCRTSRAAWSLWSRDSCPRTAQVEPATPSLPLGSRDTSHSLALEAVHGGLATFEPGSSPLSSSVRFHAPADIHASDGNTYVGSTTGHAVRLKVFSEYSLFLPAYIPPASLRIFSGLTGTTDLYRVDRTVRWGKGRGRGGVEAKLLASYQGEQGSIPGAPPPPPPIFALGMRPDDAAAQRVFSRISSFLRPYIPALIPCSGRIRAAIGRKKRPITGGRGENRIRDLMRKRPLKAANHGHRKLRGKEEPEEENGYIVKVKPTQGQLPRAIRHVAVSRQSLHIVDVLSSWDKTKRGSCRYHTGTLYKTAIASMRRAPELACSVLVVLRVPMGLSAVTFAVVKQAKQFENAEDRTSRATCLNIVVSGITSSDARFRSDFLCDRSTDAATVATHALSYSFLTHKLTPEFHRSDEPFGRYRGLKQTKPLAIRGSQRGSHRGLMTSEQNTRSDVCRAQGRYQCIHSRLMAQAKLARLLKQLACLRGSVADQSATAAELTP